VFFPDYGGRPTKHVAGNVICIYIYILCGQVVGF